jgi:transcriptional regulator with XRE-family HTH domain
LSTQAALAARAGCSQAQLARYESGTAVPSIRTLRRVLAACDLQVRFDLEPLYADVDRAVLELLARPVEERMAGRTMCGVVAMTGLAREGMPLVVAGNAAARLHGAPVEQRAGVFLFARDDRARLTRAAKAVRRGLLDLPDGSVQVQETFMIPAELPSVTQPVPFDDVELRVAPLEWLRVSGDDHPGRRFRPAEHRVLERLSLALAGNLQLVDAG